MEASEFDYELPKLAIAQSPVEPRDSARLLVDRGPGIAPDHRRVRDLPSLLGPGDVVVLNDTSVLPARLKMRRDTGGLVEVLLLEAVPPLPSHTWEALVRPSRKLPAGTVVEGRAVRVTIGEDLGEGRRLVELHHHEGIDLNDAIAQSGEMPLPPYIHTKLAQPDRYQTVYRGFDDEHHGSGDELDSVAAPTAGLHLTTELLRAIEAQGAEVVYVRLAVGLGTFRPITSERVEDHHMHAERFSVPPAVLDRCEQAERVIAVGTTVVRALESAALEPDETGRTDLFIHGDYDFKLVDAMVTNFHVPRSSLLVMIDAFVGPRWRQLYRAALDEGYRFLSFGDAMFLQRSPRS